MTSSTYTNICPSTKELREFAYNEEYLYIAPDWDICVVNFDHRSLYLEFALDDDCWQQELFPDMLYVLAGTLVHDAFAHQLTVNDGVVVYIDPIKGPGEPLPADVRAKVTTLLDELKEVQDENIGRLRETITAKLLTTGKKFNYDFWFHGGWKPVEQPEVR